MGDSEQVPIVGEEATVPPPAYQQEAPKTTDSVTAPPNYSPAKSMPLPTYDQSEKYEKDGVLHVATSSADEDSVEEIVQRRMWQTPSGSCFEFMIFFLVCALFSVIGFLFTFCLATTTAAQSGAIAGLGTAFITKPLLYELYYKDDEQWTKSWCAEYGTGDELQKCVHWSSTTMRTVFLIIGLFGLLLLYKGFSAFFRSRAQAN